MRRAILLFLFGAVLATSAPAYAQWSTDPAVNLPVATGPTEQRAPHVIPDGAHGALVLYEDTLLPNPLNAILVMKHVLAGGALDPTWPSEGVAVTMFGRAGINSASLSSDGTGGAFVAWTDINSPWNVVRTAHVFANGTLDTAWATNTDAGVGRTMHGFAPSIVSDDAGGAIVTWAGSDSATSNPMWLSSQHLQNDGQPDPGWPAGGRISYVAPARQPGDYLWSPDVTVNCVADGRGGVFAFAQHYNGYTYDNTPTPGIVVLYAAHLAHILADGSVTTSRDLGSSATTQSLPYAAVLPGGAIAVTFQETSISPLATWIDFVRYDSDGRSIGGGAALAANEGRIVGDGFGGAYAIALLYPGVYAWHLLADGTRDPSWPLAGRLLSAPGHVTRDATLVSDGPSGAIAVWRDQASGGGVELVAQRVQFDGTLAPGWPAGGFTFCTAPGDQGAPVAVSDFSHGMIAVWPDPRSGGGNDIYAQRVSIPYSLLDAPLEPAALAFAAEPNPASRSTTLHWSLSDDAHVKLTIFDAAGRLVRTLAEETARAGVGSRIWDLRDDSGARVAAGLYFARLTTPGVERTRRIVALN